MFLIAWCPSDKRNRSSNTNDPINVIIVSIASRKVEHIQKHQNYQKKTKKMTQRKMVPHTESSEIIQKEIDVRVMRMWPWSRINALHDRSICLLGPPVILDAFVQIRYRILFLINRNTARHKFVRTFLL